MNWKKSAEACVRTVAEILGEAVQRILLRRIVKPRRGVYGEREANLPLPNDLTWE
ncbi:hypothetical protein HYPP_00557 [Hyphomicrobium sp. ghe19]|nr:hypothetical protein HYPP_00557 [Hyphomicrobium sp. ghe19]